MNCSAGKTLESVEYRYSAYDLLRRIFLWEFPLELLNEIVNAATVGSTPEDGGSSSDKAFKDSLRAMASADLPTAYRDIHVEYTRLFVGPRHLPAPPYESVYRSPEKLMMQDATFSVRAAYEQSGFKVIKLHHVPDDSVGIELEFMCALTKATRDALRTNDYPEALKLVAAQRKFHNEHLLNWIPVFCNDIVTCSTSEFWQSVAVFAREFVQDETDALSGIMKELEGCQNSERSDPT